MGRARREMAALALASGACVLVAAGLSQGVWLRNIHNGILGVSLSLVGAWLTSERPRSREGSFFLAAGVVEAVMFFGRQFGHTEDGTAAMWLGWFGVWPIAIGLLLTTVAVVCFPDGHLPSPRWSPALTVACVLAGLCAVMSALWPVEWASAGLPATPPIRIPGSDLASTVWGAVAHPLYVILQFSWIAALAVRWRAGRSRAPLLGLLLGVAAAFVGLAAGMLLVGSPTPGLVAVSLIPLAAGWSAVHGHVLRRYRALSWLTDAHHDPAALPTVLARTAAEALDAPEASVWMGDRAALHVLGAFPEFAEMESGPRPLDALPPPAWPVLSGDRMLGALVVPGVTVLTRSEQRLVADLSAQAALLLERLTLAELVRRESTAGHLDNLTPRERQVLELMARGLSNTAICQELHLSVKTVEPLISTIFDKLGLHADRTLNRRVLAALEYHRG